MSKFLGPKKITKDKKFFVFFGVSLFGDSRDCSTLPGGYTPSRVTSTSPKILEVLGTTPKTFFDSSTFDDHKHPGRSLAGKVHLLTEIFLVF